MHPHVDDSAAIRQEKVEVVVSETHCSWLVQLYIVDQPSKVINQPISKLSEKPFGSFAMVAFFVIALGDIII